MEQHVCEYQSGWINKTKCTENTIYRCPMCAKWVCQKHGLPFVAEFWQNRVTGLVCSENCLNMLPYKCYAFKSQYNGIWEKNGMHCEFIRDSVDGIRINGRDMRNHPITNWDTSVPINR